MHLSLIQEGEELEKKSQPGPWEVRENTGKDEAWCDWHDMGPYGLMGGKMDDNDRFVLWMHTHAKELLEAARWAVEHQELRKGEVRINPDGKSITLDISAWQEKGIAPSKAMQIIIDIATRVMYPPNDTV